MKPEFIVDGGAFDDLTGFAALFSRSVLRGEHEWHGNLNAFNDILRGGFGSPDGGFILVWRNHRKSKAALGSTFDTILEIIKAHGVGGNESEDGVELILE